MNVQRTMKRHRRARAATKDRENVQYVGVKGSSKAYTGTWGLIAYDQITALRHEIITNTK